MSAELMFGEILLTGGETDEGATFAALGDDVEFGAPEPVESVIASLLADGDVTQTTRWGNREIGFRVEVSAADSSALASAAATLEAEVGKRSTLTWTPADGFGAPTVFDVETSSLAWLFNDLDEVDGRAVMRRTFRLRLVALPFGRSVDATVIGGEFTADTLTIVDDCQATTGWSLTDGWGSAVGTFTVDSTAGNFATGTGAVKLVITPNKYGSGNTVPFGTTANYQAAVLKSGLTIDATLGAYLTWRIKCDWHLDLSNIGDDLFVETTGAGRVAVSVSASSQDENGFIRLSVLMPDAWGTVTAIDMGYLSASKDAPTGSAPANPIFWFDSIGYSGSGGPQGTKLLQIGGTARTEASIALEAGAVGLGDCVVYTCPDEGDGFRPDLRWSQATGTTTADAKALSGTTISDSTATFEPGAAAFRPGAYAVLGRVRANGAASVELTVQAQLVVDGVAVGPVESTPGTGDVAVPDATDYYLLNAGVLYLPPLRVDPTSQAVIRFTTIHSSTYLDELLVFPLEDAALTWVRCGHGSPSASVFSRLWIDAPTANNPRPGVLVGNDEDRTDARAVQPFSRGRHLLKPGPNLLYALASASGITTPVSYFKRWHFNAAEEG